MLDVTGASDAPTLHLPARNGESYAYRRFGATGTSMPPLLLLATFRANLDVWDPVLLDALALQREVVLVDNTGVGRSTGTVPCSVVQMAYDALSFLDALHISTPVDVLGHGLGGMVAQDVALLRPREVRRLILAGTGPYGDQHAGRWAPDTEHIARLDILGPEELLKLLFEITESSRVKGRGYLARAATRTRDRDLPSTIDVRDRQYDAITAWCTPDPSALIRLAAISSPTLVATGDNDALTSPQSALLLTGHLPHAWMRTYPDAGHGFLFQYPVEFATLVAAFLS